MTDNTPQTIPNPFGNAQPPPVEQNALANSDAERAIQEVQASMVIAKRFPRNQMRAMERIINACTRETLANGALYSYPRGGTDVTGPSIRLAEAMAQEWGNMQFGIRELSSGNGVSTVEVFAWDVETNTRQVKAFQVAHNRYTRAGGVHQLTDPRDIYEVVANQSARRLRACILGVIPGDVTEAAIRQCEITQASTIETTPEAIKRMVQHFNKAGVTQELIEARLGKRVDAINAPQMQNLRKISQSLRDGMSKPSDWFDMVDAAPDATTQTSDTAAQVAETTEGQAEQPETEEETPIEAAIDGVLKAIAAVESRVELTTAINASMDLISRDDCTDDHRKLVNAAIQKRMEALKATEDEKAENQ